VVWIGAHTLIGMVESNELQIIAAAVGRFYGDGLSWSLRLPLDELIAWMRLIPKVVSFQRGI
jgi:hypothetical protein